MDVSISLTEHGSWVECPFCGVYSVLGTNYCFNCGEKLPRNEEEDSFDALNMIIEDTKKLRKENARLVEKIDEMIDIIKEDIEKRLGKEEKFDFYNEL